jgi:ornithine cyclodeaminase/alanine dehydrogenase-like protein (mu-crystallin family)
MSALENLRYIDATALRATLSPLDAVIALESALRAGHVDLDGPPKTIVGTQYGEILMMPAELGAMAGVKLVTVAPANAGTDVPRIQGVYVLFDATTLTPIALVDGAELTTLRTPAVSALAVRHLAARDLERMVVFGTGPQAWGHVEAVRAVRGGLRVVDVVARDPRKAEVLVARCREAGLRSQAAGPEQVGGADLVVCSTTARTPLFDSSLLPDHAMVVAIGSHELTAREVDSALVGRATVVVESRGSAAREAGDIALALQDGVQVRPYDLSELARGEVELSPGRPRLFKSVGEPWEDLVVAAEAFRRIAEQ